jgi:type IV pilus assembly protein PilC
MKFAYEAVSADGNLVQGTIDAGSAAEAMQALRDGGAVPVRVRQQARLFQSRPRVKRQDLVDFLRILHDLVSTGSLPLLQAIGALEQEQPSPAMTEVIRKIRSTIQEGRQLSRALSETGVFPEVVIRIIEAGQEGGQLDRALDRAARSMERDANTAGRIRGAAAYPALIIIVAIALIVFMTVSIMPRLTDIFEGAGIALPVTTQILIGMGSILAGYWWLVLPGALGIVFALRWWLGTPSGQLVLHSLAWRAPLLRLLTRKIAYARWAGVVAAMHASGVPLPEALRLARGVCGNALMGSALVVIEPMVAQGSRLSEAMRASGAFPSSMIYVAAIGEDNGTLDEMLGRTAARYETETDRLLERLPQLLEPALLVVVGVIVGVVLLSFYWPLFQLYQAGVG